MSKTNSIPLISYLRLMRLPNTFTAMADVIAGYLIVMGPEIAWIDLLGLLLSTSCIYSAGCVLNDISDCGRDALEHPLRPIPSGRVSVREAAIMALILYIIGLTGAFLAGSKPVITALVIILFSILYNFVTKDFMIIGPLTMAACRAFNLILGMSPALSFDPHILLFPVATLCYVFFITALSRFEEGVSLGKGKALIFGSAFIAIAATLFLGTAQLYLKDCLIFLVILLLVTSPPLFIGLYRPGPLTLARAITFLILGIPILDAVYVSSIQGLPYGVPVALCAAPSVVLSRFFYVT